MRYFAVIILLVLSKLAFAQGINFEKELNYEAALEKAKSEDKLIYIDFYTTWCGPCKIMAQRYFSDSVVGDKYNDAFVSLKIDAEKGEGIILAKMYEVVGYPTSLFIDPSDQTIVYRGVGCPTEREGFLEFADITIQEYTDPMEYEEYVSKFENGDIDSELLLRLIEKSSIRSLDYTPYLNAYFLSKSKEGMSIEEAYSLLTDYNGSVKSELYKFVDENFDKLSDTISYKSEQMSYIAYNDMMRAAENKDFDLYNTAKTYYTKYDPNSDRGIYDQDMVLYRDNKPKVKSVILNYGDGLFNQTKEQMQKKDDDFLETIKVQIRSQLELYNIPPEKMDSLTEVNLKLMPDAGHMATVQTAQSLNQLAWNVYERYPEDKNLVSKATLWAHKASDIAQQYAPSLWPAVADTEAHLLAISGKKKEAIELQTKAVEKAKESEDEDAEDLEEYLEELKSK